MDNGLVLLKQKIMAQISVGLNPFCNGQWSRTPFFIISSVNIKVLILFVMDNGLVLDHIRLY